MERTTLITVVHQRLSDLATEAGLTASESDYGNWVDYALRALRLSAVTTATGQVLNRLIDYTEHAALLQIRSYFAVRVDIELGPRREKFNQILKSIDERVKQLGIGPVYTTTDLSPPIWDEYVVSSGDRSSWPINWWQLGYGEDTYNRRG
jgi:hypothetical protein